MSGLIERIRAHARPGEARRIEVPEWGEPGAPLVILHGMVTLQDIANARAIAPTDPMRQGVEILCMKAMGEDGQPLFRRMDAVALMQEADPVVLSRVLGQLTPNRSAEDIEKN